MSAFYVCLLCLPYMQRRLARVQTNLHLVLAFSPVGDAFRNRLRQVCACACVRVCVCVCARARACVGC